MVQDDLEERLKNWSFYCAWGQLGPEIRTRAASAEGEYVSEDVWDGEEPRYEPDMVDGELLENVIRQLPDLSRRVLKARYIQFPYHLKHNVAQRLKISVDRLDTELLIAKRRIRERLNRTEVRGLVQPETRTLHRQQG